MKQNLFSHVVTCHFHLGSPIWENTFTSWHRTSKLRWDSLEGSGSGRQWVGKTILPHGMGLAGWKWQVMRWENNFTLVIVHEPCKIGQPRWYTFYHFQWYWNCGTEWYWCCWNLFLMFFGSNLLILLHSIWQSISERFRHIICHVQIIATGYTQ